MGRPLFARYRIPAVHLSRDARGQNHQFLGLGLSVPTADDLQKLARATGQPVEAFNAPGGARSSAWKDPKASRSKSFTATPAAPLPPRGRSRTMRRSNRPSQRRAAPAPAAAGSRKLGHLVLEARFRQKRALVHGHVRLHSVGRHCLPDGTPVGSFMRLDRGNAVRPSHPCSSRGLRSGRCVAFRSRRPRRRRNGATGDDGQALQKPHGASAVICSAARSSIIGAIPRDRARALRRRRPVRRLGAARLPPSTAKGSGGPRSSRRFHRCAHDASPPRHGDQGGDQRQAALPENACRLQAGFAKPGRAWQR